MKTVSEIKKIIYDLHGIKLSYSEICKHSKSVNRISKKVTYINDDEDVISYFSLPSAERRKLSCIEKYGENYISEFSKNSKNGMITIGDIVKELHKDKDSLLKILNHINITPLIKGNKKLYDKNVIDEIKKFINEHPNYSSEFRNESIYKKYGVNNASQSKEIKDKKKQSYLAHYGCDNYMKTDEAKEKFSIIAKNNSESRKIKREENLANLIKEYEDKNDCLSAIHINEKYNLNYNKCGHMALKIRESNVDYTVYKNNVFVKNTDIDKLLSYIRICKDFHVSSSEKEVCDFVKSVYHGKILENNRHIIAPSELDIFIPNKNIAIEYNGLYYHSMVDKNYHYNKYEKCNEKGIRLIQIFEDEWILKNEICKSIIKSSLGIYDRKIFARNCEFEEISSEKYKLFLNENHIQGSVNSKWMYGLFYNNELVQCIGLGSSRFKKGEIELHRMCTKLNTQIIGGFSKLMKNTCKELNINEVYSYVDLRLFNGKGYESSSWKIVGRSEPNYFYIPKGYNIRESRIKYQKHKLNKILKSFDENLSEKENMFNNGYRMIYDCGNLKVKYTNS